MNPLCVMCAQSCLTLWDHMDYSLPGSSVHRIFLARIQERIAISSSRGSSWPRDRTRVSCVLCTAGRFFTMEPLGKPTNPLHPEPKMSKCPGLMLSMGWNLKHCLPQIPSTLAHCTFPGSSTILSFLIVKAMVFPVVMYGCESWSCMDVRVGLWRKLSAEELMLLNCGVGEDSWESLGLQGDPTSPS